MKSKAQHKRSAGQDSADYTLVYSTDPVKPRSKELETALPATLKPACRLERKGRGGKCVTVIYKLPAQQSLVDALVAFLKQKLGTGGTSYLRNGEGIVEIQGEHCQVIPELIKKFKWPDS